MEKHNSTLQLVVEERGIETCLFPENRVVVFLKIYIQDVLNLTFL